MASFSALNFLPPAPLSWSPPSSLPSPPPRRPRALSLLAPRALWALSSPTGPPPTGPSFPGASPGLPGLVRACLVARGSAAESPRWRVHRLRGRCPRFLPAPQLELDARSPPRRSSLQPLRARALPALFAGAPRLQRQGVWRAGPRRCGGRGSPSMSLVTVLKCIPAGDPSSRRSFAWSEDSGPGRAVRSAASAATREAMLNALARGDSGPRGSIGAQRPGRRCPRLRAPSRTGASPAHGTGGGGPAVPLTAAGQGPGDYGVTAPHSGPVAAEGPQIGGAPWEPGALLLFKLPAPGFCSQGPP